MKYLFICGCPRSGTTALWDLIKSHKEIAIGVERYISKCYPNFQLSPTLFTQERFFNLQEGDTHYTTLHPQEYYSELKNRWNNCKVMGDKIPNLYVKYDELFNAFDEVKVIFIYRNIFDVANSFMERFNDPKDDWTRDFEAAVKQWNASLARTFKSINQGYPIHCVEYEKLFFEDYDPNSLLALVGLKSNLQFEARFEELKEVAKIKDEERNIRLTSLQKRFISSNANFNLYKKLKETTDPSDR